MDQDELAIVVMEEYDLDLQEWCFWPQGWESYGFIASDGHQRVFVKLLDPRLSSHQPGVRQCKQALSLTRALAQVGLDVNVPIATTRGALFSEFGRFKLIVSKYITGDTLQEKPWPREVVSELGNAIGISSQSDESASAFRSLAYPSLFATG